MMIVGAVQGLCEPDAQAGGLPGKADAEGHEFRTCQYGRLFFFALAGDRPEKGC